MWVGKETMALTMALSVSNPNGASPGAGVAVGSSSNSTRGTVVILRPFAISPCIHRTTLNSHERQTQRSRRFSASHLNIFRAGLGLPFGYIATLL